MNSITKRKCNFSTAFVQELLHSVDDQLASEISKLKAKDIILLNDYKLELYLIVCSKSIISFLEMARRFEHQQDPKISIEDNEKESFFLIFKNQCKETEAEESIACTICAKFENPTKKQIRQTIGNKIIPKMRNSMSFLGDKGPLKVKILTDLLDQDDFKETMLYVKDIQACIEKHIRKYTTEFCDEKIFDTGLTQLQIIAQDEVHQLVLNIKDVIRGICTTSENLDKVREKIASSKKLHQLIEYDDKNIVGNDLIKDVNLSNLKDNIIEQLQDLETRMQKSFALLKGEEAMIDWNYQPHEILKNVIGCTAACPFCKEQCDILDEDHLKRNIPH